MEFKKARLEDTEVVNTILVNAAKWLQSISSKQWEELLEGDDVHGTNQHIENGNVYIAWDDDEAMGVFTLVDEQGEWDKDLWGEDKDSQYAYLHRIAINRAYSGQGLGGKLVQKALEMTVKLDKKALRLDCNAKSPSLNEFYQSQGLNFVKRVDDVKVGNGKIDLNLYQKEI